MLGVSAAELGRLVGASRQHVNAALRGERQIAKEKLELICAELGLEAGANSR
jgi:hypothetical protein